MFYLEIGPYQTVVYVYVRKVTVFIKENKLVLIRHLPAGCPGVAAKLTALESYIL